MPQVQIIQPSSWNDKKLRVAAYCRVSSDSSDQLNSFATQLEYYTEYIQSNEEWKLAGVYADEGISGTGTEKRTEFLRLLNDCRAGKIDFIITKSISRFARNTLDCINTVRELSLLGISVKFEKEGLDTGNMGGEMLLSILGSIAQEESLSISNNMKWSYQKRMRSGDFITNTAPFGYILENGTLVPNPQEAPVVQYIFNSYLSGKSMNEIAAELNERKPSIPSNRVPHWYRTTIKYILSNEKYIGNALLQKWYTPSELPFKQSRNHGEEKQYYITNSHTAIIAPDIFSAVQTLLKQRAIDHTSYANCSVFPLSGMLTCSICSSHLHRQVKRKNIMWACHKHIHDKNLCPMKSIPQDDVYDAFIVMHNKLRDNLKLILYPMLDQLISLKDKAVSSSPETAELYSRISELLRQNHTLSKLLTQDIIDYSIYSQRLNDNNAKSETLHSQIAAIRKPDRLSDIIAATEDIVHTLECSSTMVTFASDIFSRIVRGITIYPDKLQFKLVNELTLEEARP